MQSVSMLEIRRDARGVVKRLARGECLTLTYRNRAIGELRPISRPGVRSADDPVYRLAECAEDLGGGLDARAADALIYGA
jgi:antitoxin (DNA-binding transcriptional repressor) of toxin-antitoxin stability system